MWYTILVTLIIDVGGLFLMYALLRDRVRRATSAAAQIAELREEVSRLVVELNQTTERNVALLEDRITGLTDLLAASDRKIGLLRREIERHDVGAQVYSRLAEGGGKRAPGGTAGASVQGDRGRRQPPQPVESAPSLSVELSSAAEHSGGARPAERDAQLARQAPGARTGGEGGGIGKDDVHQRVMMLSNSGFSANLIATRVGIPLGEVELIIALERQRTSQAAVEPGGAQP